MVRLDTLASPSNVEVETTLSKLPDGELDVLLVLVLLDQGSSIKRWLQCCHEAGVRRRAAGPLSEASLTALAERLVEETLIVVRGHGTPLLYFEATIPVALTVIEQAHARGRLEAVFGRMRSDRRWRWPGPNAHEMSTDLRVAVVRGDPHDVSLVSADLLAVGSRLPEGWWLDCLGPSPRREWLDLLEVEDTARYLRELLSLAKLSLVPVRDDLLESALSHPDKKLRQDAGRVLTLLGEGERAMRLDGLPKWGQEGLALLAAFWAGDYEGAAQIGDAAVRAMKQRKLPHLPDIEGVCHVMAALATCNEHSSRLGTAGHLALTALMANGVMHAGAYLSLGRVYRNQIGELNQVEPRSPARAAESVQWLTALAGFLHDRWLALPKRGNGPHVEAVALRRRALDGGYAPVARELGFVIEALENEAVSEGLVAAFRPPPAWEAALASLDELLEASTSAQAAPATRHEVSWELEWHDEEHIALGPRIRRSARARKGQPLSWAKLLRGEEDEWLDDADRRVLAAVERVARDRAYSRSIEMVRDAGVLLALVGHPRVIGPSGDRLVVERGAPKIRVLREPQHMRIVLDPPQLADLPFVVFRPSPGRVVVYEASPELRRVAEVLTRGGGLEVPEQERGRLAQTLTRLTGTLGVSVEGEIELGARRVAADPRPVIALGWEDPMLVGSIRVAPLGVGGPHLMHGVGTPKVIAEVATRAKHEVLECTRDLDLERTKLKALWNRCPTLSSFAGDRAELCAPSLVDALEILLELEALGDEVVVAWQAGKQLRAPRVLDLESLEMGVGLGKRWLDVTAQLAVDEDRVLDFRALLGGRTGERFVALGRQRFVALTDRLRKRIDELENLGFLDDAGLHASPALLPALEDLASDLDHVTFDHAAKKRLAELRRLEHAAPKRPRGFAATLRDYQREGYAWMWRLAEAGLGACLADDMGLGKTVQTLALLAQRARLGPALVVCPTSVVQNWRAETERFAPNLRVVVLGEATDRAALVARLGPRDVLVCSYALMTSEVELLRETTFGTAVFDEAHALKNDRTQRARAAVRLDASFRLALTGTPVENHVGELWSLFRVIVPGLLGSKEHFKDRFVGPIESGVRERAASLRALIRPFVLRRTKAQVLDELPPRTEIVLRVPPHPEEHAFYEALRRNSLLHLETAPAKKRRFLLLGEIIKLRQAAVDPRVYDSRGPKGAKLDVLVEHLVALREEGHRALIFTQFLDAMDQIRRGLDRVGIEYHELDGSTPAAERARRIEAFQNGEGDVFILSLRAGGLGINLTGADYVFHVDPWWNPAVEDQATDRAHRIGQRRPVTVYRLVTQGTIEEKILSLHEAKRHLADDLLSGLETADKLNLDELMQLLQD